MSENETFQNLVQFLPNDVKIRILEYDKLENKQNRRIDTILERVHKIIKQRCSLSWFEQNGTFDSRNQFIPKHFLAKNIYEQKYSQYMDCYSKYERGLNSFLKEIEPLKQDLEEQSYRCLSQCQQYPTKETINDCNSYCIKFYFENKDLILNKTNKRLDDFKLGL
jgi:hypothetical protein